MKKRPDDGLHNTLLRNNAWS